MAPVKSLQSPEHVRSRSCLHPFFWPVVRRPRWRATGFWTLVLSPPRLGRVQVPEVNLGNDIIAPVSKPPVYARTLLQEWKFRSSLIWTEVKVT
jgi:hypothetical protein